MPEHESILGSIHSPEDLKKLTLEQLWELASETKNFLIQTVSMTGGHLASNLGVIEMTLALHYSLDCPHDKLIWDVGHQCYVHKMITGRRNELDTLRQYGGLSGFPKRRESDYDAFDTGHSSTAISAALGMARARDMKGEKHAVVAVVGDGAMTGGLSWEALNDAGHKKDRIIIVLNDNEMSITRNVGALSAYLARVRSNHGYARFKGFIQWTLDHIPFVGERLFRWADRVKNSMKYLLVPGMVFEEMGYKYYGPINGHDIEQMINVFKLARQNSGPVLIHAITQKGRGYAPAQKDPEKFHATGPFDRETGQKKGANGERSSCDSVMGRLLLDRARRDERICVITAAMPDGCGLGPFIKEFPNRCFDVGIAEQHAATMAAGMAAAGLRPVFTVYSSFAQRAYDQILHDICLQNLPVVLLISHSGLVGADGETHHGIFDHSYLRQMPGMHILAPATMDQMGAALDKALHTKGPTAICYPKGVLPQTLGDFSDNRTGWQVMGQSKPCRGALLAVGMMTEIALEAANLLSKEGIAVNVVDCMSIKPLDTMTLDKLTDQHQFLFTIEDHILQGGFGSAVLEYQSARGGRDGTAVYSFGIDDCFIGHGPVERLLDDAGLSARAIKDQVLKIMGRDPIR